MTDTCGTVRNSAVEWCPLLEKMNKNVCLYVTVKLGFIDLLKQNK